MPSRYVRHRHWKIDSPRYSAPAVKCPTPEDSSLIGPGQLRRSGGTTLRIHGYRLAVKHRVLRAIGQDQRSETVDTIGKFYRFSVQVP